MGQKKIGIKYCGGCNPSYDRVAMAMSFKSIVKDLFEFSCREEQDCDIMLFVNGCPGAGAGDNAKYPGIPLLSIVEANGFKHLPEWLAAIAEKED